jgi:hypothetical protein
MPFQDTEALVALTHAYQEGAPRSNLAKLVAAGPFHDALLNLHVKVLAFP